MLTIMRLAREREKLRVVQDQTGCPTWSRMIAETTALALKAALPAAGTGPRQGVYHLCSSGQTSWHGFARAIVELMPAEGRKCREIEAIRSSEFPSPARRPPCSVMSCRKLERDFGLQLPDWRDSLRQVLEQ
jgi:dTDP-4-dehydrorhamnose reductase